MKKERSRRIENLFNHSSQLLMLVTTNASANVNEKKGKFTKGDGRSLF